VKVWSKKGRFFEKKRRKKLLLCRSRDFVTPEASEKEQLALPHQPSHGAIQSFQRQPEHAVLEQLADDSGAL